MTLTNEYLRRTRTQIRNGYAINGRPVEVTSQSLAEFFPAYDHAARAKILNDMDAESESFEGDTMRETADNLALRAKLESVHQALIKAGR
jgi:hypothetical protein